MAYYNEFQVRSEYGMWQLHSIVAALDMAAEDPTVWKISFKAIKDDLHYRFIRDDQNPHLWHQEPMPYSTNYAPQAIWTENDMKIEFTIPYHEC